MGPKVASDAHASSVSATRVPATIRTRRDRNSVVHLLVAAAGPLAPTNFLLAGEHSRAARSKTLDRPHLRHSWVLPLKLAITRFVRGSRDAALRFAGLHIFSVLVTRVRTGHDLRNQKRCRTSLPRGSRGPVWLRYSRLMLALTHGDVLSCAARCGLSLSELVSLCFRAPECPSATQCNALEFAFAVSRPPLSPPPYPGLGFSKTPHLHSQTNWKL
ncbi:hypothetical protein C8Q79DRAFT_531457 [Trametes meyenii]|nr:hypothetical protein C8Q79DRAFT_531457 [Trametes meyenii]